MRKPLIILLALALCSSAFGADTKLGDLPVATSFDIAADLIPFVDVSVNAVKNITPANFKLSLALTKSDVSLGNVENTALSTWAGSTAITTLGTIATGTVPWARLSSTPTTLSGYGITDAVTASGTQTLTNKRVTKRVVSTAYGATITPNADTTDVLVVGSLTGNVSLANPSGTPTDGQALQIEFRQDGTGGRSLTLGGTKYRIPSSSALTSPITDGTFETASKKTIMSVQYDATDDKWDVVAFIAGY